MSGGAYYHGGVTGLAEGDLIAPGHTRDDRHPGCAACEARAAGMATMDAASARPDRVYLTTDKAYARFHASLYGHGDLYIAEPVGAVEPSEEDPFPSFVAPSARVVAVLARGVVLTHKERRAIYVAWAKSEGVPKAQAIAELDAMVAGAARAGKA